MSSIAKSKTTAFGWRCCRSIRCHHRHPQGGIRPCVKVCRAHVRFDPTLVGPINSLSSNRAAADAIQNAAPRNRKRRRGESSVKSDESNADGVYCRTARAQCYLRSFLRPFDFGDAAPYWKIFGPLAGFDRRGQPAWFQSAPGPGLSKIFGISIFGNDCTNIPAVTRLGPLGSGPEAVEARELCLQRSTFLGYFGGKSRVRPTRVPNIPWFGPTR